ncbi:c-Myc-binding protein-like [Daktulosphaira vitifoliae]|uniref:c-Myc-binding protein-like n=1 Tax=Daktulosphaira vitifoliae TaxID=58002 RepID=UPI0021A9D2CC|nr:c-Myc-binding protein-like [Daktulosphaira vitifoliae]XP_050527083.1 c-Myc-binding protein-like [Daktulosphaira vitifoliae]
MAETRSERPLDVKREEFKNFLETAGVLTALTNVLIKLYELDEKPVDPLEFMRNHMTEIITEKVELEKLKEEFETVTQQIYTLQQENVKMTDKLKELEQKELEDKVTEKETKML